MSISDYQYLTQTSYKTFVLEDESTLETQVVNFGVETSNSQVDLFQMLSNSLGELKNICFKIYDFSGNKYVNLQSHKNKFKIPKIILQKSPHVVLIKYNTNCSQTLSLNSIQCTDFNQNKSSICSRSQRSKERIILEVIQIVKKWRSLHENPKGKCLSLPESAKVLGMPKKSLDDYYYQLRMGQKYGFDFHTHMMDGIGVLRSFLKRYKNTRRGEVLQKLPSSLKIVSEIDLYQNVLKKNSFSHSKINLQRMQDEEEIHSEIKKDLIQKSFYNEFNYDSRKEADPFVNLGRNHEDKSMLNIDYGTQGNFDLFF